MTVANFRYNHIEAPWDAPLSLGMQAFIEYNGVVLNNTYQSDVIRVNKITGLEGAEIRDAREPRPSAHGEFVYDAFYGGRVITISGFIETASLQVFTKLRRNILAAFAPLVEAPLKFRWFDIEDNFEDPQSLFPYNVQSNYASGNYSSFIGSLSSLEIKNNSLKWAKSGNIYILRTSEQRTFCDVQQTLRITVGNVLTTSTIGFIQAVKNNENYIRFLYAQNDEKPYLIIHSIVEGVEYELGKITIPTIDIPVAGQQFWLRGRKEGNLLTIEYWLNKPEENEFPAVYTTAYLTGKDSEIFGEGVLAQVGLGGNQVVSQWSFNEFKVESIYPGDVVFNVRTLSSPSIPDEQTTLNKVKRPFQVTLKASDFRAFSSVQVRKSITPVEGSSPVLGRSYPRSYPLSYKTYISSSFVESNSILSVNNKGTVFVEPRLTLRGPGIGVYIENLTNGQNLVWNGIIEKGEEIIFDCKNKILVNQNNINKQESLVPNLQWIKLDPMNNDLYIQVGGSTSETLFTCWYNHGYNE
jgi:Phage tail protein